MTKYLTTAEAGRELGGISCVRVLQLIRSGRLKATKHGRDFLIDPADLDAVRHRPWGRPKSSKNRLD